jgi:hypothetical protein
VTHPEISILWLRDGEGPFPHVSFSGEGDAETVGWASFTATSRNEVVIFTLTSSEWNAGDMGGEAALKRIRSLLGRSDLVQIKPLRVEKAPPASGSSFQAFRQSYERPKLIYSSLSGEGEARVEREQSAQGFLFQGGVITHANA